MPAADVAAYSRSMSADEVAGADEVVE